MVLVEGESDRRAVEVLAARHGRDLAVDGIEVMAMGGATNIGGFVRRYGPDGLGVRLAGLCDEREEGAFRRALERAGLGAGLDRRAMEDLGFFVCVADLEDELIRALGPPAVEEVLAAHDELVSFRRFQRQPAQRARPLDAQLRRFLGTRSGRKIGYGGRLVAALDLTAVPRPLAHLLAAL